jgi:Ni/Fe-hydrogenase subunit HybB-like protein
MSQHEMTHSAVGGPLFTPFYKALLAVVALGAVAAAIRFALGLGTVSNLNDGYPWGIWIALDVVTGTALGCGGYAVALLVYILNKGEYHPLVRPAVLTSLLGYGLAVLAVTIDLGRYWDLWKIPVYVWRWTHSPQLEVALCVATYCMVLLLELSPAVFEKWRDDKTSGLRGVAETGLKVINKAFVWILALGMLLPTMHQSTLGTMMLLPSSKLHPLWWTPWLPMLFLVNCILMGYGAVVLESHLSSRAFHREADTDMLAKLSRVAYFVAIGWLVFRIGDVVVRGAIATIVSGYGVAFLIESAVLAAAIGVLSSETRRRQPGCQFRAAMLLVLAGTLFRIDTYLVAFRPGRNWTYFPAVPEVLITLGIIALEVALYLAAVKKFPILSGHATAATATR